MPELPEVESLARFLSEKARGRTVERAELASFPALKTFDPPLSALLGRTLAGVGRRGKFLVFDLGGSEPVALVLHLARGGWARWRDTLPAEPARPGKGPLALRLGFAGGAGMDVTEAGTEKRLALYVVRHPEEVDGIARLGPDPLAPGFDPPALAAALAAHGGQLKAALVSQTTLAGVGNAYSDEALHLARLSPFKAAGKLSGDEVARLHAALVQVLADALARSSGRPASELKDEKRSGMRVHGRKGQACPECGDTVREVAFATRSLQYCATCQTGGKPLADRRLSRLLK